ncbi:hypothetical protein HK101_002488 [Irineochytrium annulatum]|nr:hypothetical protein HK101_002488 [Irineochytrium annulatum]
MPEVLQAAAAINNLKAPPSASDSTAVDVEHEKLQQPRKVPKNEQPVLRELFDFRRSLVHLRRDSHGAITLADVDAKANELSLIMHRLREVRRDNAQKNRLDDVVDSIWMHLFYIWTKIATVDDSLYPLYVNLVSVSRTADVLRASGEWCARTYTIACYSYLHYMSTNSKPRHFSKDRLREVDSLFAAGAKFISPTKGSNLAPGQAVLASLLSRAHRAVAILNDEAELIDDQLRPIHDDLVSLQHELEFLRDGPQACAPEALAPLADRVRAIEASRGPTGRFDAASEPTSVTPRGQPTCAALLSRCFNLLAELESQVAVLPASSPLQADARALDAILTRLIVLRHDNNLASKPAELSSQLVNIQRDLAVIERRRICGTFVPPTDPPFGGMDATSAALLPGQHALHRLLRLCHEQITAIVDPLCRPVSETLLKSYEDLVLARAALRRVRRDVLGGRCAEADREREARKILDEVAAQIRDVERTKVRGLFRGHAAVVAAAAATAVEGEMRAYGMVGAFSPREETAEGKQRDEDEERDEEILRWLDPKGTGEEVPAGQAVVGALVDECESLLWETRCLLDVKGGAAS